MLPTQMVLGGSPTQFGGCCKNPPVFVEGIGGFFFFCLQEMMYSEKAKYRSQKQNPRFTSAGVF
tara:strand:- start:1241 stop:1432 length:192 start_codon:yes stop_codon:yes gene_type:complete